MIRPILILASFAFVSACADATIDRLPYEATGSWKPHEVYSGKGQELRALAIAGLIELPDGSLIVSDAESGQLVIKGANEDDFRPMSNRRFRPLAPAVLGLLSDSLILSTNWSWFQVTNIRNGSSADLQPPKTPWGTRRAGEFILSPDGARLIVAPSTSGPFMTVLASSDKPVPSLTTASLMDLDDQEYFGPVLPDLGIRRSASLEHRVDLAGWEADSLVVLSLYDGKVSIYPPTITAGTVAAREFSLPWAFLPKPTIALNGNNVVQPQLAGGVLLSRRRLAVLRHTGYRWRDYLPWRRVPGYWWPSYAVELYSLSGQRLANVQLPNGYWRG